MSRSRLGIDVTGPAGAPVLLLGGSLGTTLQMWDPQHTRLAEVFRVVRFDHLGHGRSAVPRGPYRIEDLAGEVLALLDDLAVPTASYAGLSLGGMVGLWLAAHAPGRVQRLVVLCSSAWLGPGEAWTDRASTVRAHGTEAVADAVVGRWFTPDFAAANPELVMAHRSMLLATPDEGYASCCEAIAATDLRGDLAKIGVPTLVVAGSDDPVVPVPAATAIADVLPSSRLEIVDRAAHLANVEQADTVTRLLLEHLCTEVGTHGRP